MWNIVKCMRGRSGFRAMYSGSKYVNTKEDRDLLAQLFSQFQLDLIV